MLMVGGKLHIYFHLVHAKKESTFRAFIKLGCTIWLGL